MKARTPQDPGLFLFGMMPDVVDTIACSGRRAGMSSEDFGSPWITADMSRCSQCQSFRSKGLRAGWKVVQSLLTIVPLPV